MIDDPAVRSVRVAVALCDRFTELLRGPTTVTAHKQRGALVGFSGNQDELSLRIGEAQQLYPEIWRHLDDARTAFAGQGIDVTAFDALRGQEGKGIGASVEVDYQERGFGRHEVQEHTKSAGFNTAGLARARSACDALMKAAPHVDWAAIAKSEANDPLAAAFGRSTRNKRMMQFGLLGLAIAAPFLIIIYMQRQERAKHYSAPVVVPTTPLLSDDESKELAAKADKLHAITMKALVGWNTATTPEALRAIAPGTRPCTAGIHEPAAASADAYVRTGQVDADAFAASAFTSFMPGKDGEPLPDPGLSAADTALLNVARRLATGNATASDAGRLPKLERLTTFVIIDKDVEPEITQSAPRVTYKPGAVTARAYVFSLEQADIVCAGNLAVQSSPSEPSPKFLDGVRRVPDAAAMLHRELEVRLRQALAANLKGFK